jgi:hypothetical protein
MPARVIGVLGVKGQGRTTETVLTALAAGLLAVAVTGKSAELLPNTQVAAILDRNEHSHANLEISVAALQNGTNLTPCTL